MSKGQISILGAGAYGSALASAFARNGRNVRIWARDPKLVEEINSNQSNTKYLGPSKLPGGIVATQDLEKCCTSSNVVIYACPSSVFTQMMHDIKPFLLRNKNSILVNTAKGLETSSLSFHHQVIKRIFGYLFMRNRFLCLSGPSFAAEIFNGMPTCVTLAGFSKKSARYAQLALSTPTFRPYISHDLIGCQLGGAMKNVVAIAAGLAEGMNMGSNTMAALINLGFAEIVRFGISRGGKTHTFLGLSGMGDLMLTCYGSLSRNRSFGIALGQGKSVEDSKNLVGHTIEGIQSTRAIYELSKAKKIDLPICREVYKIIYENKSPKEVLNDLLAIPVRHEWQ